MTAAECLVVVPTWNEAKRLPVDVFLRHIAGDASCHFLFVDDGSTDQTAALLQEMSAAAPHAVRVIVLPENRGKAEAVRLGLLDGASRGYPAVGFLDADLSAPLDAIGLLQTELDRNAGVSLVLGSRVKLLGWDIARSELRHYLGRVFATFASIALALPVYDTQCGAKLLRMTPQVRDLLASPFVSRWLFDVELIARVRDALGASAMREVPLPEWRDTGGSSVRLRDFVAAPIQLLRIRLRYPPGNR